MVDTFYSELRAQTESFKKKSRNPWDDLPETCEDAVGFGVSRTFGTLLPKMPTTGPSYWVLTGDRENWRRGISDRIWGVMAGLRCKVSHADRVFLFFYAKSPASRIFGTGIVRDKFRQDRPLWIDEVEVGKVLYPCRFTFDIVSFIDEDR